METDLLASARRFESRVAARQPARRRSDKGRSRLPPIVLRAIERHFQTYHRPSISDVSRRLAPLCKSQRLRSPSRATLYQLMKSVACPTFTVSQLPPEVRDALYNIDRSAKIPGHQLAFYCLNYGSTRAIAFTAGLPWLCLYQAGRMRGWRPKSRGLLSAIVAARAA